MRGRVHLHVGIAVAFALGTPLIANAQVPVVEQGSTDTAASPPATTEPATSRRLYLRATVEAGYGRFEYPDYARYGGGLVVSTGITVGVRVGPHLMIGGSGVFLPVVRASGQTSGGDDWGPLFAPGGYFGVTLGVLGERLSFDLTVGGGGAGVDGGAGGFGGFVVPSATATLVDSGRLHVGLIVKPFLAIMRDPGLSNDRVFYFGGTAGVSIVLN